jgi:sulfite reductase (NADPH) flavoprotein alpha-component
LLSLHVQNSPFTQQQVDLLNQLLPSLTESQRHWLSGYLAALGTAGTAIASEPSAAAQPAAASQPAAAVPAGQADDGSREVTVLYGSQTGNSQGLAKTLTRKLEERGFRATLSSMRDFKPAALKKVRNLFIVVSTHGEGEPPDNAVSFHEFLHSKRAPRLEGVRFSVLALGDTSYEKFCQTGKDFDRRLEELGAQRLCPRVDCDVDYDEPAAAWMEQVLASLSAGDAASATISASASAAAPAGAGTLQPAAEPPAYSRTRPFYAEVLDNINLNGRGSDRETRHLVLSLEGSGFRFEPGDCVGIYPENDPALVDQLIEAMGWNAEEPVPVGRQGEERPLREALLRHYEITVLTRPLLEQAAPLSANGKLRELVQPGREQELKAYVKERDLLDLVRDFGPWQATPRQFAAILRKIPARLYSIASSFKANPDEVALTIRAVRYEAHGRLRKGVCSVQCAERLQPGDKLPIYIHSNPNFKMPSDPDTPIVMIGPGTGVAPFRAFLEEREETGARGRTWLFFGDRRFRTDFLYQTDWQRWLKEGVLTRMDVAFSRDTAEKVYVQHRMLEKSRDLYAWLMDGAAVYVCGDEKHMAHDVHRALAEVLAKEGGMSREDAEAYLENMQQQGRYQRDVY